MHIDMSNSSSIHASGFRSNRWAASLLAGLVFLVGAYPAAAQTPEELFSVSDEASTVKIDHSSWDGLLKTYVKPDADGLNRVDYAAFKASGHQDLKAYVRVLEAVDPQTLNRNEQFAYLANLYNAKTVDIVLDHYPVKSIKDISLGGTFLANLTGGPWKAEVLKIKGVPFSLDDIEHGVLRPLFKDPRVHYAVNCASVGCPNLGTEAFTGEKLEAQLDAGARAYVNTARGVRVSKGKVVASSIYSWFQADFGGNEAGVLAHLKTYAAPELAQALAKANGINDYDYDWNLNDIAK